MATEIINAIPLEIFAFLQLMRQQRTDKIRTRQERRKNARRMDKRLVKHRRRNDVETQEDNKRTYDRRDILNDRRRKDRRALERIRYI